MNQVKINYSLAKCRGLFILAIPKTHFNYRLQKMRIFKQPTNQ